MVLGVDKLHELINPLAGGKKLVEGLCERELTNPEGCGFDLRLGKLHKISGRGFMGLEHRSTPEAKLIAEYDPTDSSADGNIFVIKPGEGYLATIVEKVNMPDNLTAQMTLRSTFYRSGIIMQGGNIPPGYFGELSFFLYNAGPCEFTVELGSRITHIVFWQVDGATNLYRGQWKGGRVSTTKLEKQV